MIETRVSEDAKLEQLIHLFDENHRPLLVDFENSDYPGNTYSTGYYHFSEDTKTKNGKSVPQTRNQVRNTYFHFYLQRNVLKNRIFSHRCFAWKAKIGDVYTRLIKRLPKEINVLSNPEFRKIFLLRKCIVT